MVYFFTFNCSRETIFPSPKAIGQESIFCLLEKNGKCEEQMNSHEPMIQSTTFYSLHSLHHNALSIAIEDEHNNMLFLKLLN